MQQQPHRRRRGCIAACNPPSPALHGITRRRCPCNVAPVARAVDCNRTASWHNDLQYRAASRVSQGKAMEMHPKGFRTAPHAMLVKGCSWGRNAIHNDRLHAADPPAACWYLVPLLPPAGVQSCTKVQISPTWCPLTPLSPSPLVPPLSHNSLPCCRDTPCPVPGGCTEEQYHHQADQLLELLHDRIEVCVCVCGVVVGLGSAADRLCGRQAQGKVPKKCGVWGQMVTFRCSHDEDDKAALRVPGRGKTKGSTLLISNHLLSRCTLKT